jgi:hypothetical protein
MPEASITNQHTANSDPQALPKWITRELLDRTIRVWQKFYPHALTDLDAAGILVSVARLGGVLAGRLPAAPSPRGA